MLSTSDRLMLSGGLVLLGIAIRWKTSAYDLKDAAIDSGRGRWRAASARPRIRRRWKAKYRDIQDQATWTGKATKTADTVAGHFIARVLGWVALILMLAGLVPGVAARLSDAYWPQALCTRTDCI
jgi:hypothetical protein